LTHAYAHCIFQEGLGLKTEEKKEENSLIKRFSIQNDLKEILPSVKLCFYAYVNGKSEVQIKNF
jgi:hypothetical protein